MQQLETKKHAEKGVKVACRRKSHVARRKTMIRIVMAISLKNGINKNL
jgi:hypothetical protein